MGAGPQQYTAPAAGLRLNRSADLMTTNRPVALVTGASSGIGKETAVYATARDRARDTPDAVPLALEVTDPASVAAAAEQAQDVTTLINHDGASAALRISTPACRAEPCPGRGPDIRQAAQTDFRLPAAANRATPSTSSATLA